MPGSTGGEKGRKIRAGAGGKRLHPRRDRAMSVAEAQHRRQRFAALHKFKLRPGQAALYLVPRGAMPRAFLDVSSLNLAAFPAAKFLRNRRRRASQKPSGNGHPDVTPGFLRPQGSFPPGGTESTGTPSGPASPGRAPFWRALLMAGTGQNKWSATSMTTPTI